MLYLQLNLLSHDCLSFVLYLSSQAEIQLTSLIDGSMPHGTNQRRRRQHMEVSQIYNYHIEAHSVASSDYTHYLGFDEKN